MSNKDSMTNTIVADDGREEASQREPLIAGPQLTIEEGFHERT